MIDMIRSLMIPEIPSVILNQCGGINAKPRALLNQARVFSLCLRIGSLLTEETKYIERDPS